MSGIFTILVKHLVAAGATAEAILDAVSDLENEVAGRGANLADKGGAKVAPPPQVEKAAPQGESWSDLQVTRLGLQKLRAQKVITATALDVGLVLVNAYNRKTGRCDPGIAHITRECGHSRRSVQRAVSLLSTIGAVKLVRNGGNFSCNKYGFDFKFHRALASCENARKLIVGWCQNGTPKTGTGVTSGTQTQSKNIITTLNTRGYIAPAPKRQRRKPIDRNQREMIYALAGGKSSKPNAHLISLESAEQRLIADYCDTQNGGASWSNGYRPQVSQRTQWLAAIEAERHKAGTGLKVFQDSLWSDLEPVSRTATGPP